MCFGTVGGSPTPGLPAGAARSSFTSTRPGRGGTVAAVDQPALAPRSPTRVLGADGFEAWSRAVLRTNALRPVEKGLLLVVGTYDWGNWGDGCTAPLATLARCLPSCLKTTKLALKRLRSLGLVSTTLRSTSAGRRPNSLRVNRAACLMLPQANGEEPTPLALVRGEETSPLAPPNGVEATDVEGKELPHTTGQELPQESRTGKAVQESGTTSSPIPGSHAACEGESFLREALERPEFCDALDHVLSRADNRTAAVATIRACGPGGAQERAPWPTVGEALLDYANARGPFSPGYFRGFVRYLKDGPNRARAGGRRPTQREKNLAVLDAALATCDAEEAVV